MRIIRRSYWLRSAYLILEFTSAWTQTSHMMEIEEGFMKIQSGYCLHFTHCSSGLKGPKTNKGIAEAERGYC